MSGMPLHPLVVHFPIVLAVLLPISCLVALWAVGRGTTQRRAWLVPVVLAAALTLSAAVAVRTGRSQEERVERVVAESALETHEEAAERFLVLSGVLLVVALTGLTRGTVGQAARLVSTAGALGLVLAGVQTGHSGGKLVYREGAAGAYVANGTTTEGAVPARRVGDDEERDDR